MVERLPSLVAVRQAALLTLALPSTVARLGRAEAARQGRQVWLASGRAPPAGVGPGTPTPQVFDHGGPPRVPPSSPDKPASPVVVSLSDIRRTDGCGNRCSDFDGDCWGIADKFHCWKYDPERGVCPFLTGDEVDRG